MEASKVTHAIRHDSLNRKKLSLPLRTLAFNNAFSPVCGNDTVYSPVTSLAFNLNELSTDSLGTPKRRLSLSSDGTPTPVRPVQLGKRLSYDAGCCMDSPSPSPDMDSSLTDFQKRFAAESDDEQQCSTSSTRCSAFRQIGSSPAFSSCSPCILSPRKNLLSFMDSPLPEDENDSQDSGLGSDKDKDFHFAEPTGPAPRKLRLINEDTCSPNKYSPVKPRAGGRRSSAPVARLGFSFGSPDNGVVLRRSSLTSSPGFDDCDDGFLDILELSDDENDMPKISGFSGLLSAPMVHSPEHKKPSPQKENRKCRPRGLFTSPKSRLVGRSQSFEQRSRPLKFKRSEMSQDPGTPVQCKRRKSDDEASRATPKIVPRFQRSSSEAMIKSAMNKGAEQPDLLGDFSRTYALPLTRGKHQDLKSITPETMAAVLNGEYDHVIEKCVVLDCRYPYEYDGGHIQTAKNIYTKEALMEECLKNPQPHDPESEKRTIYVFHCEFSSERGPSLMRYLRSKDREANKECYPSLFYPEVYLLDNGYKAFFESELQNCQPQTYKPMLHENHAADLKHFRAKTKSGEKGRPSYRPGMKL